MDTKVENKITEKEINSSLKGVLGKEKDAKADGKKDAKADEKKESKSDTKKELMRPKFAAK